MSKYKSYWIIKNGKNKVNVLFSKMSGIPENLSLYNRIKGFFGKENDSIGRMIHSYVKSNSVPFGINDDKISESIYFSEYDYLHKFVWSYELSINGFPIYIKRSCDVIDVDDVKYTLIIPLFGNEVLKVSNSILRNIIITLNTKSTRI